ncbi:MAG: hypothetical protein AAFP26_13150, partial [Planctomycetota bacterium]
MLDQRAFSYAAVPYVIKPFEGLVRDPESSISFDQERHDAILELERELGSDARLVLDESGEPVLVTLLEKLLVVVLARLANFVPGGGIWMNTQRPEWNDANNALAGNGLSMVTLYQLRRFVDFGIELLEGREDGEVPISSVVRGWSERTLGALVGVLDAFDGTGDVDDRARWRMLESLAKAGSGAREAMREDGMGRLEPYPARAITDLFRLTRHVCDHTIRSAKRDDGLYESYNVLHVDPDSGTARVERLHLMLEGQVNILACGILSASEASATLDALFESPLYRDDQRTFMLYPRADRVAFTERNVIPESAIAESVLLERALEDGLSVLVTRDCDGRARFAAGLVGASELEALLARLADDPNWSEAVTQDRGSVRRAYEQTFGHARFTGRSGTMHKYEGIGSVYWHMVSKLLLSSQECAVEAWERGEAPATCEELGRAYRRVRDGLG